MVRTCVVLCSWIPRENSDDMDVVTRPDKNEKWIRGGKNP